MQSNGPYRIAIAGCGGYARSHHHAVYQLESDGIVQLIATKEIYDISSSRIHPGQKNDARDAPFVESLHEEMLEFTESGKWPEEILERPESIIVENVNFEEKIVFRGENRAIV